MQETNGPNRREKEAHDLSIGRVVSWAGPLFVKKPTENKFCRRRFRSRESNSQNPNKKSGKNYDCKVRFIVEGKTEKWKKSKLKTLSRHLQIIHGKRRQRERGRARRHFCTFSM